MMALSGVLSSWDMLARNADLWRLATSSCWKSRAFWMASADCVAKVRSRSTVSAGIARAGPAHGEAAEEVALPQHRHGEERAHSRLNEGVAQPALVGAGHPMSGTCTGSSVRAVPPTTPSPFRIAGAGGPRRRRRRLGGRALDELLGLLVVLEDDAAIEARELHGARDDGGQHRLEVQRGGHRLPDLAQRGELPDRALELGGARLELGEQPRILDGDDRLVGKRREGLDLRRGERARSAWARRSRR